MLYQRARTAGATYFFTLNLANRRRSLLTDHIKALRTVIARTKQRHPFNIDAMVVMPEHLHTIWTLPNNDDDYPNRWMLIKSGFSRQIPSDEQLNPSRISKRERGIWQRRYWEHQIRDAEDYNRHVDYIHYNPVKHGHVKKPVDWPYSSIHSYIEKQLLPKDWANGNINTKNANKHGER